MVHLVKCFAEIQQYDVCLFAIWKVLMNFFNQHSELIFTWPPGAEAMLEVIEDLMLVQVFHHIWGHYVLK